MFHAYSLRTIEKDKRNNIYIFCQHRILTNGLYTAPNGITKLFHLIGSWLADGHSMQKDETLSPAPVIYNKLALYICGSCKY